MAIFPKDEIATEATTQEERAGAGHGRIVAFWDGGSTSRALPDHGEIAIGRSMSCDLAIDHGSVSRKHALLRVEPTERGPRITVEDLGSSNGTRVGAVPLARGVRAIVSAGEAFEVGSVVLVIQPGRGSSGDTVTGAHEIPAVRAAAAAAAATASVTIPPPPAPRGHVPTPGVPIPTLGATQPETPMARLERLVRLVSAGNISVLLTGETGVGKEVLAERIHKMSRRANGPFVRINAAALSDTLLESELFGHEKGAFTGATSAKVGLLEAAHGGTFFFDEVGELPLALQAKLLRVLESREVLRVGSIKPRPVDVRFIAATNRDLATLAQQGAFREDLYFRLNGITLAVPPLRARRDEIGPLARTFAEQAAKDLGRPTPRISPATLRRLQQHPWPGNVRELRNTIERAVLLSQDNQGENQGGHDELIVDLPDPAEAIAAAQGGVERSTLRREVDEFEKERIVRALDQCAGNQTKAAQLLGISRRTLLSRLDEYGLPRPRK